MPITAQFTSAVAAVKNGATSTPKVISRSTVETKGILDRISDSLARSLARPFCPKCNLSQTDDGGVCDHCRKTKAKKDANLKEFLSHHNQED